MGGHTFPFPSLSFFHAHAPSRDLVQHSLWDQQVLCHYQCKCVCARSLAEELSLANGLPVVNTDMSIRLMFQFKLFAVGQIYKNVRLHYYFYI